MLKHRVRRLLYTAEAERKIRHLAYHDTLTGLPNRLLFMDRMDQAISRAFRANEKFTLLFIDIDHFKVINDSMGHEAGDQLLTSVTQRLQHALRRSDTIARLGGDEFTVILENISELDDVMAVTQNLLDSLSGPLQIGEREVQVGASIGIAIFPEDGTNFGTLLKHADTAMYRAKEQGRNKFEFYKAEMSSAAMYRLELENSLRKAIDKGEFVVYYQPKYELKTRTCWGMEALVRWQHPEEGLISPDDFIPLAEETGIIVKLGRWVIETACEQFSEWKKQGYKIHNLAINISARQFSEQNLPRLFETVLKENGLDARDIEIELTENTLVENHDKAKAILNELHEMGLRIALDDFGTGYASMAYLKDFPIDTVKIDRSFITDIPNNVEDMAIVRAISSLTKALDLCLIAEGAENDTQIEFLKDIGCEQGQGFYWSKPVPAEVFEVEFLRKPNYF